MFLLVLNEISFNILKYNYLKQKRTSISIMDESWRVQTVSVQFCGFMLVVYRYETVPAWIWKVWPWI